MLEKIPAGLARGLTSVTNRLNGLQAKLSSRGLSDSPIQLFVPRDHSAEVLPVGSELTRIYKPSTRYKPHDFNYSIVEDRKTSRGRFSPTKGHTYGVLYVGAGPTGFRAALWEALEFYELEETASGLRLPEMLYRDRSVSFFETTRPMYIVNLRSQPDASHFRAKIAAIQGDDQRKARAWGHYVRRVVARCQGIRYRSHRDGEVFALALFEESAPTKSGDRLVKPLAGSRTIRLSTRAGKMALNSALQGSAITV